MLDSNTLLKNGRYRIVRQIGEGGFGVVYEARDLRQEEKKVALKEPGVNNPEFHPEWPQKLRDKVRYTFETEAKRLIKLHHAALPIAYDYFKEGDRQYFVMEYIEGPNLEEQLKQRKGQPFGVKEVLGWADQLLDVLVYLHAQTPPLIHRDIKPENIILKPDGKIMLLDFGIAKGGLTLHPDSTALPASRTPRYAPPEQRNGGTDQRSDLYALGATLYQLLTNKKPPIAEDRQQHNDLLSFENLAQNNPQIPVNIARVLASAMSLDANKRPSNAHEMQYYLNLAFQNLYENKKTSQTPTWKLLSVFVMAGVLMILAILFAISGQNGISAAADTPTPTVTASGTNVPTWTPTPTPTFTASPAFTPTFTPLPAFTPTFTPSPVFGATPNALDYIERGDALRNEGQHEQAIAAYAEAIRLDPNNADAYFGRGFSHGERSEFDLAIANYDDAIRLNSDYASAYYNRGDAYHNQGQLDLAIADYNKVIRLNPNDARAHNNRGFAYHNQGRLDLAIADYDQAIRLNSDHALAYYNRGAAYSDQGELDLAIADYTEAIRLNPDNAFAYNSRGFAYQKKGERDLAIADYRKVLELGNNPTATKLARGNLENLGVEP